MRAGSIRSCLLSASVGLFFVLAMVGGRHADWRLQTAPPDDAAGLSGYLQQAKLNGRKVPGYLEAYRWWLEQRAGPDGRIDWERQRRGLEQKKRLQSAGP